MDIAAVKSAYRRYAKVYDLMFGAVFALGRRAALEKINASGGRRVLEVGVGTGLSLPKHRRDNRIVGIDASQEMLDVARRRVEEQKLGHVEALIEMDAENLEFPDASFDVVVAMFVMSVVPDAARCLAEMQRVCKPGGEIYMINHFAQEGGLRGRVERWMAPFARTLGWKPDFALSSLLDGATIDVVSIRNIHPLGLFSLVDCRNSVPATAEALDVAAQ